MACSATSANCPPIVLSWSCLAYCRMVACCTGAVIESPHSMGSSPATGRSSSWWVAVGHTPATRQSRLLHRLRASRMGRWQATSVRPRHRNNSDPELFQAPPSVADIHAGGPAAARRSWLWSHPACLFVASGLPEVIEAGRPAPLCPPLLERCRTRKCPGLLRQCVQVMLQVEYFLLSVEAALVPCHTLSLMPDLHVGRVHLGLHFQTDRQRNRIEVGQHLHATTAVHMGKVHRGQIKAFLEPLQMLLLQTHPRADRLRPLTNDPLLILFGRSQQQCIEFFPAGHVRYRHHMVPAKVSAFSFHATLLVTFGRRTELRFEAPMRSESDESRGLLSLVPAQ